MPSQIFPMVMLPGVQRDGTNFSGRSYVDAQHCRFQRGLPRKMGGYRQIVGNLANIPRGIFVFANQGLFDIYTGDSAGINKVTVNEDRDQVGVSINRTPANFVANQNLIWNFDLMYSTISNTNLLIAHGGNNLLDINNSVKTPVYFGNVENDGVLLETGQVTSGGIIVLHPYLFIFDQDGYVKWSEANNPTLFEGETAGEARISGYKILTGMRTRGGNYSPAGLLWSSDSVIRVTKVGAEFRFDTITDESSILSSRSVVEYDGMFFWAAVDRFMLYNGMVQELPNTTNLNWFFDNLNQSQRQKVWVTKIPKYGEIWWHFPFGNSQECNAAICYNKRENIWYDTRISRGCGYFEQTLPYPIWTSNTGGNADKLWSHETGVDQDIDGVLTEIDSYFETGAISWCAIAPNAQWKGIDRDIRLERIEPDIIQNGTINLTVRGRPFARSPIVNSAPRQILPNTTRLEVREQRREMTLKFESNEVGGDYQMGNTLFEIDFGDVRQ